MATNPRIHRRLVLPFVLAVILAGEITGMAMAVRLQPPPAASSTLASGVAVTHGSPSGSARRKAGPSGSIASDATRVATAAAIAGPVAATTTIASTNLGASVASGVKTAVAPAPAAPAPRAVRVYRGRSHVWIPALGINRSISSFSCSRSRPPDNLVYHWGCAGSNNIYLFGHAYGVFKPLHDAYVSGRLKKGMKVMYADSSGQVRTYVVSWWKVTRPTSSGWAWAAQSRPSMTLQTCVGARSEFRLIVRLIAAG